jgi:signal peptidase I
VTRIFFVDDATFPSLLVGVTFASIASWGLAVREDYIKRVVALPGDTVEMRGDDVLVNGAVLTHDPTIRDTDGADPSAVRSTSGRWGPEGTCAGVEK